MNITILPQEDVEKIVMAADYIMAHQSMAVGVIKKNLDLTTEEYDMIFELCMPRIRAGSAAAYWRTKHHMLASRIKRIVDQADSCVLKRDILKALKEPEDIDKPAEKDLDEEAS